MKKNKKGKEGQQPSVASCFSFVIKGACMIDYSGSRWKKKRKKILRLDGYVCRVAKMYGRTEGADTVHHIYPVNKYPEYAWCDWNLISVSKASHNKLENRTTGELTHLGEMLMEMTEPGMDWRKERKQNRRT